MSCYADLLYFLLHGLEGLSLSLKINHPWQGFFFQENSMMELLLVVFFLLVLVFLVLLSPLFSIFELNVSENQVKRKPL